MSQKRLLVKSMFARIAPGYDLANRLMSLGRDQTWRMITAQLALETCIARPQVLDLATGTGDLAYALEQTCPVARVYGLDLTLEMLRLARDKLNQSGSSPLIQLVNGDTLALPFPSDSFDAITSGFMLRNLVDLHTGFREMVRVTKPGGKIVALEITRPSLPIWRQFFHFYFYRIAPLLGALVSRDLAAYHYLPASLTDFKSARELSQVMTEAGVREVNFRLLNLGTVAIHFGFK